MHNHARVPIVDLNVVNSDSQTVLIKASKVQNLYIVEKLLRNGADVNQIDKFGKTALDYAVELGNRKIASILVINKASVTTQENAEKCHGLITRNDHKVWRIFSKIIKCVAITIAISCAILLVVACVCYHSGPVTYFMGAGGELALISCLGIGLFCASLYCLAKVIDSSMKQQDKKLEVAAL